MTNTSEILFYQLIWIALYHSCPWHDKTTVSSQLLSNCMKTKTKQNKKQEKVLYLSVAWSQPVFWGTWFSIIYYAWLLLNDHFILIMTVNFLCSYWIHVVLSRQLIKTAGKNEDKCRQTNKQTNKPMSPSNWMNLI